jgi:hypothetical protein
MSTGRYFIKYPNGRVFCVEPIRERNEKEDERKFTNGGTDGTSVKNKSQIEGGSVAREDSIITAENGFINITEIGIGQNPQDYIDRIVNNGTTV